MQDIEFTVERGKLWMLQTRSGKRTAQGGAAHRRRDGAARGLIARDEAVTRIDPAALDQLLHPTIDPEGRAQHYRDRPAGLAGRGLRRDRVLLRRGRSSLKSQGHKVILVRVETSPEDIHGMHAAEGILTTRGGMTSHAAVVARGMGKPCVSGAGALRVDYGAQTMTAGGRTLKKGDIDHHRRLDRPGARRRGGDARAGAVRRIRHADGVGRRGAPLKVRANADTPADARAARNSAPKGIGLCRTEHMFFDEDRIVAVREMILADGRERPPRRARQAPADAARRFRRAVRDHGAACR